MGRSRRLEKRKCMCMVFISSSLCSCSRTLLPCCPLASLAKSTVTLFEWPSGREPRLTNNEREADLLPNRELRSFGSSKTIIESHQNFILDIASAASLYFFGPNKYPCAEKYYKAKVVRHLWHWAKGDDSLSLSHSVKRERQMKAFESNGCILHKRRNHSHEDHVADRGGRSWHHSNLVHTPTCRAAKPWKFQHQKLQWTKKWDKLQKLPSQDCIHCPRHENCWTKSQLGSLWSSAFGMHSKWIKKTERHPQYNFH